MKKLYFLCLHFLQQTGIIKNVTETISIIYLKGHI